MLNVLVGYDPNDPTTAWSVGNIEKDYTKFLKADGVKDHRRLAQLLRQCAD